MLLKGLCARKQEAYEVLLNRYEAALYRFFYYSHRNHELAQDQCGETFKIMLSAIDNLNKGNSLKSFLFGIARNVMRRNWRTRELTKSDDITLVEVVDKSPSVLQQVAAREELSLALNTIQRFPDPEKQILLLRFVENFKLEEIAEVMAIPLNSVKSHIHRSRKKLCKLLNISQLNSSEIEHGK